MVKVLITSQSFRRASPEHEARVAEAGCEIVHGPFPRAATEEELLTLVGDIDGVLAGTDAFTRRVLEAAPRLKVIARIGVGYDAIDLAAAEALGIWATVTPGTNEHSVADGALALILALGRKLFQAAESTRAGKWDRPMGLELRGQVLGLIGFGRIGRQVALRARAFGMEALIYDVFQDAAAARELGCRYVSLEALLGAADFVSLHAPATPETTDIVNARTLALMKPTAYLINTARGELIDEDALYEALTTGRVAGAGLDVFKQEPPDPSNPLLTLPNVIALPHIAGVTLQAAENMSALAAENLLVALEGKRPPNPVNNPHNPRR